MNGKGFWKFNNYLLVDTAYINSIKKIIGEVKRQYVCPIYNIDNLDNIRNVDIQFTIDDQLFIDILLTEIRGKSITYSAFKEKNEMKEKRN